MLENICQSCLQGYLAEIRLGAKVNVIELQYLYASPQSLALVDMLSPQS